MIRGLWDRDMVGWIMVAAALPVAAVGLIEFGPALFWRFGLCLIVALFWQGVFLYMRAQPLSPIALVTALAVALLAPGTAEPLHLVLAASFGAVIGEQIFGGWGRNFIHPAVATLSFLYFGFPETLHQSAGWAVALAVVPGLLMLLFFGIVSWQLLAAAVAAMVAVTMVLGQDASALFFQGSLIFGLVFLVADPVASASTRQGRWAYGAIAGALAALFGWTDSGIGNPQTIIFAALLASVFAPLIDALAISFISRRWRRRNG